MVRDCSSGIEPTTRIDSTSSFPGIDRRRFLKGVSVATVAALAGAAPASAQSGVNGPTADGPGEPVIYQYFHTPWSEVEEDVDLLVESGIDAIWLPQPANFKLDFQHQATEDQEGFYEDEHPAYGHLEPHPPLGYQPVDLRDFDSPLGTKAELGSLIETLHDHGIFVIIDAVLNHMANPRAPADRWGDSDDPLEETHLDWPQFETEEHFTEVPEFGYQKPAEELEDPPFDPQFDESLLELPNLDVRHPEVQAAHEEYLRKMAEIGADGVRFDAAAHVWPWYWRDVINPLCDDLELWRVGEVWREKEEILEFVATGMDAFDFPLYDAIVTAFEEDDLEGLHVESASGVVHEDPDAAVTFAQNHDTAGPGVGPDDPEGEEMDLANAFVLSYPGTPHLFRTTIGEDLRDPRIRDLIRVKNDLACGEVIDRYPGSQLYVYERKGNLLAGINVSRDDRTETVETSWCDTRLVDHTDHGAAVSTDPNGEVEITVPGRSWVMYAPPE